MGRLLRVLAGLLSVALLAAGVLGAVGSHRSWSDGSFDWLWLWVVVRVPAFLCDLGAPMGNLLIGDHYGSPFLTFPGLMVLYTLPGAALALLLRRRRGRILRGR